MNAYGDFAKLYDELMDDFDYPAWADYYLALLSRGGVRPQTMCDCACGTGSLAIPFAKKGIRVTGVDQSEAMLRVAAEKARSNGAQIPFVRQDMCALRLPRPVDALVCACDGVNYLNHSRVETFFKSAYNVIRPGGALAFDISSEHKLRDVLGDGFYGEDRDDVAYLWFNHWDDEKQCVKMDLTFFQSESSGLYRRFGETHVQYAHDPDMLTQILHRCGFRVLGIFGDQTFDSPADDELRIHFLARRESNGGEEMFHEQ